jgi:hypothetical protein
MLDSARERAATAWVLAGFACFVVMAIGFFQCAPWLVAMTPRDAELRWPGRIDPSWRAVVNDHGRPAGWDHGTVADNPLGFMAWLGLMLVGMFGWYYCVRRARRASE